MPPLHSIMLIDGPDIWLDAVAESPALRVNDVTCRSVRIVHGDVVEIGQFRFVVRNAESNAVALDPASVITTADAELEIPDDVDDLSDVSAEQLVDLIDREEQMVEEFEQRRRLGAFGLLGAVLQRTPAGAMARPVRRIPTPVEEIDAPHTLKLQAKASVRDDVLRQIKDLTIQLQRISDELNSRPQLLARGDSERAGMARLLIESQQRIVSHLEQLVTQLDPADAAANPLRATA